MYYVSLCGIVIKPNDLKNMPKQTRRAAEIKIDKYKYEVVIDDEYIKIEKREKPMCGTARKYVINVDKCNNTLSVGKVLDYNTTMPIEYGFGSVAVNDEEMKVIEEYAQKLIDEIESRNHEGIEKIFKEMNVYVNQMIEKRKSEIERAFDNLIETLVSLTQCGNMLRYLRDPDFQEKVKQWVCEYVYA